MVTETAMQAGPRPHSPGRQRGGRITLAGALLMSCGVIATFSSLVAAMAAYRGNDLLGDEHHVTFTQAVVDEGTRQALVVVRTIPTRASGGCTWRLGTLCLRDAAGLPTFCQELWGIRSLANTPSGVFAGGEDGVIRQLSAHWRCGAARIIGEQPNDPVLELSCSADGSYLLSRGGNTLYFWTLPEGKLSHQLDFSSIGSAVLAADARSIYCSKRGQVEQCDVRSGDVLRTITSHDEVVALALHPNGQRLATLGQDRQLRVFDLPSGKLLWQRLCLDDLHLSRPSILSPAICFSPNAWLACAYSSGDSTLATIAVFHSETGLPQGRYQGHTDRVLGMAFTSDQRLYSWSCDGAFLDWTLPLPRPSTH